VTKPYFVVLAGPNGAGKTTFARANLQEFIDSNAFLNADEIARSIQPEDVASVAIEAGRRLIQERRIRLGKGQSFCVETTLATRTLLRFVNQASKLGFRTRLIFLFTPFPQLNELRVKQRVMAGGHNIDTITIHRRHRLGMESLADYWDACDEAVLFDARTENPRETLVKDDNGTRVLDQFGWLWLRLRLKAFDARIPDISGE
jgi:predicted ABC-type ATPase